MSSEVEPTPTPPTPPTPPSLPSLPSLPPRATIPVIPSTRPPGQPIPAVVAPAPALLQPTVSRRAHALWSLKRVLITAVVLAVLLAVGDLATRGFHLAQRAIDKAVPPPEDPIAAAYPSTSNLPLPTARQVDLGAVAADGSWKVTEGHFVVVLPAITERHLPPVAPVIAGAAYQVLGASSIFEIAFSTPDTVANGRDIVSNLLSFPWSGPPAITSWSPKEVDTGTLVTAIATVKDLKGVPYDLNIRALITPQGVVLTLTPVSVSATVVDRVWHSLTIDGHPAL
jgi:hypothetical protein